MVTRRGMLATGVSTVGGVSLPFTASASKTEGMVVFTYDDSPLEDYTETFPVHQEYDVPGCIAVCPGLMDSSTAYMDSDHVVKMNNAGWEVMSHTLKHRALGHIPLTKDCDPANNRIYVDTNRHGRYVDDPIALVTDGEELVTGVVSDSGTNEKGDYIDLKSKVGKIIESDDSYVRYTEEFTRKILSKSKSRINEWGIPATGFVYPYGRYDGLVERIVPEYYESVPNHRTGRGGHNPINELVPTEMIRQYIETDMATDEEIHEFMETVASRDVLGITGGHSQYDTLPADRVEFAIQSALDHNLEIVTVQEALDTLGIVEKPDLPVNGEESDGSESPNEHAPDSPDNNGTDTKNESSTEGESDGGDATKRDNESSADATPGLGVIAGTTATVGGALAASRLLSSDSDDA
ncbi:polysaccharide deacetylase family protein [Halostagnicola sp. A-GB9-2]|uniref:polysaccharide deacetylase family protein n=1 Tax=Halostagnicola sp. A-GB9-2 TaxID=3048066 RepID=UPI0024C090E6|nr:polysaccharide deacetylase family protein [Halostagnicola sp. A-GB9-2]MDJ1430684.1 polysaccharide deacetylase family protein [Halostagnicola sp. A-GB9-2]